MKKYEAIKRHAKLNGLWLWEIYGWDEQQRDYFYLGTALGRTKIEALVNFESPA